MRADCRFRSARERAPRFLIGGVSSAKSVEHARQVVGLRRACVAMFADTAVGFVRANPEGFVLWFVC